MERNENRSEDNISAHYAEKFHLEWILAACKEAPTEKADCGVPLISALDGGQVELTPGVTPKAKFEVFVDDNFHFMQEDERYSAGTFDTYEEAVVKAKSIVDSFLESHYKEGMTADELCRGYKGYGEDPFIVGDLGQEVVNETMARAKAIIEQMGARLDAHGGSFEEINKPLDLPESKVRFSAWDYAEKRSEEMCRVKVDESSKDNLKERIPAADILTAISILANRGSLKLFKRDLTALKADSGVDIDLPKLCSLAAVGCETTDDAALVNAVAGAIKADA
jgi:hypothetical protein